MEFSKKDLKKLTLDLGVDCVHIYFDYKDKAEPIHICYWLIDEWEEDSEVAVSIFRAIQLYYIDKVELLERLGHKII
jgi:hypothetical protein